MRSIGIIPISVRMDAGGLDPSELDRVLREWDEIARGCKRYDPAKRFKTLDADTACRPRVLLQVPTGQNPTGITLTYQRRQTIYEMAVKWDLIILEDDPYVSMLMYP